MILDTIFAALATLGFSMIFNIRGRKTILAAIGGGLGWLVYMITIKYSNSNAFSFFVASVAAASYSEILARIIKTPATVFIICAIIPLVPGGGMFRTMLSVVEGNTNQAIVNVVETLAAAGSIAVGIFFVSTITKIFITNGINKN